MGLIDYNNIPSGATATSNMFNERFGQLVAEFNGHIGTVNLEDGAVTLEKMADEVFGRMWPVGSVYINATDNTNPATLLGFGTWAAFGAGRVPVGKADEGTFASAGTEVGAETVTLSEANMPAHNHTGTTDGVGNHTHIAPSVAIASGSTNKLTLSGSAQQITWGNLETWGSGAHSHTFTTSTKGSGTAHNNIQPSVVVYMWKRTG